MASLCAALRHLGAPPPRALRAWLDAHDAESAEEAEAARARAAERDGAAVPDPAAKGVVRFRRRNAAKLREASRHWRELGVDEAALP